ncbi:hypothetical protein CRE_23454 [Caenorhabditis remanei]|uniref:DUF281 domain-containing protein n=1 Tax=Caenorhabditis remanei TaxID=31234 RepID=E3MGT9_CAERE|nr:hypothetical protein CRE_23454 [Caenorhabditis remanei]
MNANQVSGLLTYQAYGTYSSGSVDNPPAGQTCKVYSAACLHATQQCTVTIYATMSTGSEEILCSDVDTDLTVVTINCATDETLAFMGRGPIVRFRCKFTNCM